MNPKLLVWLGVAALVIVVIFLAAKPGAGGVENVDPAGVKAAIKGGAQVIDVRTPGEFQLGHIEGAVNVPLDQIESSAQAWDRNATYVVYCATGSRSTTAVETMKALGFGSVKHLSAGIQAWDDELAKGEASSTRIETSGKPVLVEFFTDS